MNDFVRRTCTEIARDDPGFRIVRTGIAAKLVAGLSLGATIPALHARAQGVETGADVAVLEEVVVVGTRRAGLAAIESKSPVTVVGGERLREQGSTDMLDVLRDSVPSFNVNMQPIADGATVVRPPNLRNLAADHTLVMVNGKRRHRGAVIAWLVPKASEGAQGPDLSVIPAIAVERVEVLADGASAQYGSDAVAGVMNFVLKDAHEGTSLEARYGRTAQGDGENAAIAVNRGFALGANGFLNASVEYGESGDTVRSVQREDAEALANAGNPWIPDPAQIWGSPKVDDNLKTFVNLGFSPTDRVEMYGFGNYASKTTDGGFYYRNPNDREGVYTRGRVPPGGRPDGRRLRELPARSPCGGPILRRRHFPGRGLQARASGLLRDERTVSGGLHAAVRRRHPGLLVVRRRARRDLGRPVLGHESGHRRKRGEFFHQQHRQRGPGASQPK